MLTDCARVRRSLAPATPSGVTEAERAHVFWCTSCREVGAAVAHVPEIIDSAAPPLEDDTREAILRRMAPQLDELAARVVRPAPRWFRLAGFAAAGTAVAVAATLLLLVIAAGPGKSRSAVDSTSRTPATPRPAAAPAPPSAEPAGVRLRPLLIEGELARDPAAAALLGASLDRLSVPEGSRVRAHVPDGHVELRGPMEVVIRARAGGGFEIEQRRGYLIAEIDPRPDRPPIGVRTRSALVELIGTAFSVHDRETGTEVAVLRGAVAVGDRRIEAGHPIDPSARAAIEAHIAARRPLPVRGQLARAFEPGPGGAGAGSRPVLAWIEATPEEESAATPAEHPPAAAPPAAGAQLSAAAPAEAPPGSARAPARAAGARSSQPEQLYKEAEAALRRGDEHAAAATWRQIAARHSDHPLADLALYDLARLAARRGRRADARDALERLLARDRDPTLREPARWLACQVTPEERREECQAKFRRDFPDSPHATP